jgi:anti-sigma factor RsiW
MQRAIEQDERMTRYLLGDLPETKRAAIEQEFFADPAKFEEVWSAENDLVDSYVRGRLSRGERELFERNYLRSPKHRERVLIAGKLLEAADRSVSESSLASQIIESVPYRRGWGRRMTEALSRPRILRTGLATAAMLLLFGGSAWLLLERVRLNHELGRTSAQLLEQQRREQAIADELAAEREESSKLKSEIYRLLETVGQRPSQQPGQADRPSILSFFLLPMLAPRSEGEPQQQITISREADLVKLHMKIGNGDSRRFQAAIHAVGGTRVWNQRSLNPRSDAITVNVPASKLPLGDYILALSATGPTGETEEINQYFFRVIRK